MNIRPMVLPIKCTVFPIACILHLWHITPMVLPIKLVVSPVYHFCNAVYVNSHEVLQLMWLNREEPPTKMQVELSGQSLWGGLGGRAQVTDAIHKALADDLERLTLLDPFVAQEPSVATAGRRDVSQKVRHRPTVKALTVLDNVKFRVQRCFCLLLAGNFDDVSRELPLLHKAVENIKQNADLVITQKKVLILEIDGLEAQFNSCKPPEMDLRTAVEFDTSKS
ncbi:hypothetical protein C8R48DRAFT_677153 [Suillus tomentosus]|nr:hypothetical protein C8R48DRAFT_677153 [Suillus tomentosus]